MNEHDSKQDGAHTLDEERVAMTRRAFLVGLNRWSGAVIASVVACATTGASARPAAGWVNGRGGWINGGGGGGWLNRGGGWINGGGSWANRAGGGGWINNRGGGSWVNR